MLHIFLCIHSCRLAVKLIPDRGLADTLSVFVKHEHSNPLILASYEMSFANFIINIAWFVHGQPLCMPQME